MWVLRVLTFEIFLKNEAFCEKHSEISGFIAIQKFKHWHYLNYFLKLGKVIYFGLNSHFLNTN